MDTNNWRPNQGTEPNMDNSDWRGQLQPESRQRIVNKIMDTLKRHLPVSGQEGLLELRKIAQRFEEKIFTAATSQSDYLRKISLKMLTMETKSHGTLVNNLPSNQVGPSNKPSDPGLAMQPQVHNTGQQHPLPLSNQPQPQQPRQQLLSQNIQNNIASQPNLPPVSSLTQTSVQNVGQNSNVQTIPGQNPVGNTIGQNTNMQNIFAGSQRPMPGRQQVVPQQQQQSQNPQQYLYQQQQIQQQILKHKFHMQSQMQQQQQQQNLLQPNQMQSSQQSIMQTSSVMQPSMMQTSSLSNIQHNQQSNNVQQTTQSMIQQHPQVIRQQQQASIIHQQQTSMAQQSILAPQQQQLLVSQTNATNMQHAQNQMLGPQNNVSDMQQPQRLLSQQNNLSNLQQLQQPQQLINQQNNLSNMHQQLGNNVSGLQTQQVLGPQSGNSSGMQTSQHSAHMLQQSQQNPSNLLPSQTQQSQPQAPQQQLMPQIQSQPAQLQQQLGLQQQTNPLQRDMQQRLQASGSLLQQQGVLDQQKQLYQRPLPETSSTSMDSTAQTGQPSGGDWQEEVYQKIKTMKDNYLSELNEMHQKISSKLQQSDSLTQQPKTEQTEKLKVFKMMLERIISFLQVSKSNILPNYKEKLGSYEKQIINFINANRPREVMSSMQPQGQVPPTHMHSMLQPQQQSQVIQVQSHENQMNSQFQSESVRCSVSSDGKLISELREEISNLQSSLSEEVKNLKDKLQKMEDDRRKEKEEWSLKMKGLTKEISELKEKVETREHQHSLARAELLREIENLQGEKASSSSQVVHQWI